MLAPYCGVSKLASVCGISPARLAAGKTVRQGGGEKLDGYRLTWLQDAEALIERDRKGLWRKGVEEEQAEPGRVCEGRARAQHGRWNTSEKLFVSWRTVRKATTKTF